MRTPLTKLGILGALGFVAGCSSGQSNAEPGVTQVNLNQNKAELAVGIATFTDGSKGLNTVATFRQPDGLSATLVNTPTITGPAGFKVPNVASAGIDAGTNHISASPQVPPLSTPTATTFGESGGVFAYGFAPINSDTSGAPNNAVYAGPFYGAATLTGEDMEMNPIAFRGGPPLYPNSTDPNFGEPGFEGYTQGFVTFAVTPVRGTYSLSVVVPAANAAGATIAATPGTLSSTAGLGAIAAAPVFTEDGSGGGTATCTVPTAAYETIVDLTDDSAGLFYTVVVAHGGFVRATFADDLGVIANGVGGVTIASGDEYSVSCIATNYPAYEAGPPNNLTQLPTITGSNGQADISFSPNFDTAYGGDSATAKRRPHARRIK
jgi:hypothetical protein